MLDNLLNAESSAKWLTNGNILLHPTEGVWGIGCDAFNRKSFLRIYDLNKRSLNKSFILLASSLEMILPYIENLTKHEVSFLNDIWPGHTTILFKYNADLPDHLKNKTGKIAIRVSNHYPINTLFNSFRGFLVSTSANISGTPTLLDLNQVAAEFINYNDVAVYNEGLGDATKSSKIIDLETRKIIRD